MTRALVQRLSYLLYTCLFYRWDSFNLCIYNYAVPNDWLGFHQNVNLYIKINIITQNIDCEHFSFRSRTSSIMLSKMLSLF